MKSQLISVPAAVTAHPQIKAGGIIFTDYQENGSLFKNQVVFDAFAFSFVLNGQKEIYRAAGNTVIKAGQAMLIPQGNSIIAEHSLNRDQYHSVVIFFPGCLVDTFFVKHALQLKTVPAEGVPPYVSFAGTPYLDAYIRQLSAMIRRNEVISDQLALHKLEELLLVLYESFPVELSALFGRRHDRLQLSLKSLVENNLYNKLTLEELAFLANRSLSSFKRDFEKAYGLSPQRYIRERKLEAACAELVQGKPASELYDAYGYENLSNFNTAFKRQFGVTPSAYRMDFLQQDMGRSQ